MSGHAMNVADMAEAWSRIEAITEALQHLSLARLSLPHDLRGTLDAADTKLRAERERWERRLKLDEAIANLQHAGIRVGGAQ